MPKAPWQLHQAKSQNEHNDLHLTLGEGTKLTSKDLSGAQGSRISVVKAHNPLDDYKARTVRQLSRLWRYLDGADPTFKNDTYAVISFVRKVGLRELIGHFGRT